MYRNNIGFFIRIFQLLVGPNYISLRFLPISRSRNLPIHLSLVVLRAHNVDH